MQRIVVILLVLTFIQLWIDWLESFPVKPIQKLRYSILNFKPFNCSLCLSLWIGVIITLIMLDPLYLTMPLFNKATEKLIY